MAMGSWMLITQATRGYGPGPPWPVLHAHLLLVGFLLLLIFGIAFWMFPRVGGQRVRAEMGWISFALVNAGILLRLLAEPLADGARGPAVWRTLLGIAAVLPVLGAVAFGLAIWPRVRAAMSPAEARAMREARGLPFRD